MVGSKMVLWVTRPTSMRAAHSTSPTKKTAPHGGAHRSADSSAPISTPTPPSVNRRRGLFQPARLANVDHDVGQRAAGPRPVPVLLIRFGSYRVPNTDSLGAGPSCLNPSLALDDVQELTAFVRMPVITNPRLEAHDHAPRRA